MGMLRLVSRITLAHLLASSVALAGPVASSVALAGPFPDGAKLERVATDHGFTEGPVGDGASGVYFTDVVGGVIYRYDASSGDVSVVRSDTQGAAGLAIDASGRLVACEARGGRVVRFEPDGSVTVLASEWRGKRLNSPNDLVLDGRGGIYFSDPRYRDREKMELDVEAVYYVTPDGELRQVVTDLVRPNGLVLSNDGKTLYVSDHAARKIWAYDVGPDGALDRPRVFAPTVGVDGMAVDAAGNVYGAGGPFVWVWNARGEPIDRLPVPEPPRNCAIGGSDPPRPYVGSDPPMLYVTAGTSLYRIPVAGPGGQAR